MPTGANLASRPSPSLWAAALAIPVFALLGSLALQYIAVVVGSLFASFRLPWDTINLVTGASIPFLAACRQTPLQGCEPVAQYPFLFTLLQWAALAGLNVQLIRAGVTRRPWVSGLVIVAVAGLLAIVAVRALSLEFDHLHM